MESVYLSRQNETTSHSNYCPSLKSFIMSNNNCRLIICVLLLSLGCESCDWKNYQTLLSFAKDAISEWKLKQIYIWPEQNASSDLLYEEVVNFKPSAKFVGILENLEDLEANFYGDSTGIIIIGNVSSEIVKKTAKLKVYIFLFSDCMDPISAVDLRLDSKVFLLKTKDTEAIEYSISEKYSIFKKVLIDQEIGFWSLDNGLDIKIKDIWHRRKDLRDIQLKTVAIGWLSLVTLPNNMSQNLNDASGLFPEILKILSKSLNFKVYLYEPPDGSYGGLISNDTWSGAVGELKEGNADLSIVSLTASSERSLVIDFLSPILDDITTLIGWKSSGQTLNVMAYFDIFLPETWLMLTGVLTVLILLYYTTSRFLRFHLPEDSEKFDLFNSTGIVCLNLIQKDYPLQPSPSFPIKVLNFLTSMTCFLVFAFYTGVLTSTMTFSPPPNGIRSFRDAIDGIHQTIVLRNAFTHNRMKLSTPGTSLNDLFKAHIEGKPQFTIKDVPGVTETFESNPKFLLLGSSLGAQGMKNAVVLNIEETLKDPLALAVPKNSELYDLLNFHIQHMKESGLIQLLIKRWNILPERVVESSSLRAVALNYENILFPFIILATGVLFSGMIIFSEKCKRHCGDVLMIQNLINSYKKMYPT